jgi:hypothetical protein
MGSIRTVPVKYSSGPFWDRRARGYIDGCSACLETRLAQGFRCRRGILLPQISQQDMFACTDTPGDGLADRSCAHEHYYSGHFLCSVSLFV